VISADVTKARRAFWNIPRAILQQT